MKTQEAKKWERRSEARPGEITAAALKIFAVKGFAATRLDDVAAAAGVSKATVYLYFDSKEQLFEAIVREGVTPSIGQLQSLVQSYSGSTPSLIRLMFGFVDKALDTPFPALAKLVISESGNFPALAKMWGDLVVTRGFAILRSVVQRGVDRGEFRPVVVDEIVPLFVAPLMFLVVWEHSIGRHIADIKIERRALLDSHADMILRGLAIHKKPHTERKNKP